MQYTFSDVQLPDNRNQTNRSVNFLFSYLKKTLKKSIIKTKKIDTSRLSKNKFTCFTTLIVDSISKTNFIKTIKIHLQAFFTNRQKKSL